MKTIFLFTFFFLSGVTLLKAQPLPNERPSQGAGDNADTSVSLTTSTALLIGLGAVYAQYKLNKKDKNSP